MLPLWLSPKRAPDSTNDCRHAHRAFEDPCNFEVDAIALAKVFEQDQDFNRLNSKSAMSHTPALCGLVGKTVLDCDVESAILRLRQRKLMLLTTLPRFDGQERQ